MKIIPPPGYEIDKENSTFECIKFKRKLPCYAAIAKELFLDKGYAYAPSPGGEVCRIGVNDYSFTDSVNCVSEKQLEKLLALNKLINVAKYLNGDWTPLYSNSTKFYLTLDNDGNIIVQSTEGTNCGTPMFKESGLADQAVKILGEEIIQLALSQV